MRSLVFLVLLWGGCPNDCDVGSCSENLQQPDLTPKMCTGDLGGSPRDICGKADFSFSSQTCSCIGDP